MEDNVVRPMTILTDDGGIMLTPQMVHPQIEEYLEHLATDDGAINDIGLANIIDSHMLAFFVEFNSVGYLSTFTAKTGAATFEKHFPGAPIPDEFFAAARDYLANLASSAENGLELGPLETGIDIARRAYQDHDYTEVDVSHLDGNPQSGVLLQQLIIFGLLLEFRRGYFTI